MKNITDKSQFNLTNAKVQIHGSVTFINFPRDYHRTLSGAVHYIAHTELVAHQSAPGEIFKVVAVNYYISKAYANASDYTGSFHNEAATEEQIASILA